MAELDLYRMRECAFLDGGPLGEDNPHHVFAYARWIRRQAEELLYEDLWAALDPDPDPEPLDAPTVRYCAGVCDGMANSGHDYEKTSPLAQAWHAARSSGQRHCASTLLALLR